MLDLTDDLHEIQAIFLKKEKKKKTNTLHFDP